MRERGGSLTSGSLTGSCLHLPRQALLALLLNPVAPADAINPTVTFAKQPSPDAVRRP